MPKVILSSDLSISRDGQKPDACIFRPKEQYKLSLPRENKALVYEDRHELQFRVGKWGSMVYRLNPTESHLEIEWSVGPIPLDDGLGKEVVFQVNSSVTSEDSWYTYANGIMLMERSRHYRPAWNVSLNEPIAGNYYPITTAVGLKDNATALNIVLKVLPVFRVAHSRSWSIAVCLMDGSRGAAEPLNENEYVASSNSTIELRA